MSDWTIITVTFNSAHQLRAAWPCADIGLARWIVVDNASSDDSALVAEVLGAEVVRLPRNIGFAAANNIGLRQVRSPWVAFVNPDVEVAGAHDLDRLASVSVMNRALVSPQLLNTDGTMQPNARGLPFVVDKMANRSVRLPGSRPRDYTRTDLTAPTFVAWTMGAAVMGPSETVRQLGGWDERYFIYYEDHDFGLRAWRCGVPVVVDPGVRWRHGWDRATSRLSRTAWQHEIRSARKFYSAYPELVTRGRFAGAEAAYGGVQAMLWRAAAVPRDTQSC